MDLPTRAQILHNFESMERTLSPFAATSVSSKGREQNETATQDFVTPYQVDRQRILYTNAFRRMKHKTQVFLAPQGDHFTTRMTHTLEVCQTARTIALGLNLNTDLTEAIALGHDLGHTPFGHLGEEELNNLSPTGFSHNVQSLRILDTLENEGLGLNLSSEVRQGIVSHSKPRGHFLTQPNISKELSLEGQIVRISDALAYLNHDLLDSFRSGMLTPKAIPQTITNILGTTSSERMQAMILSVISSSWEATGSNGSNPNDLTLTISATDPVASAIEQLREFLFRKVYLPVSESAAGEQAREIMQLLYDYYTNNTQELPPSKRYMQSDTAQRVQDFVSGMTDQYALATAETLRPGIGSEITKPHMPTE
jgi:dGTPase